MGEVIKFKKKKNIPLICTIVFVIVVLVFLAVYAYLSNTGLLFVKPSVKDTGIAAHSSGECIAVKYKDGMAILGDDSLIGMNKNGKEIWNLPLKYQNPKLDSSGRYVFAQNLDGNEYMLISSGEIKQSNVTNGKIITGAVNSSGYYAIAENEKGYHAKVTVYNSKGKTVYTWHTSSYIVTDIALAENNRFMSIAVLETENGNNISAVLLFNFSKNENIYCPAGNENMIFDVSYAGSSVIATGDKAAFSLSSKGAERWRIEYNEKTLENYISDKNGITFAFSDPAGTKIESYSTSGNKRGEYLEEKNIKNIDRLGSYILMNLGNEAKVINLKGKVVTQAMFDNKPAKAFLVWGRQKIITMTGNSVYINIAG